MKLEIKNQHIAIVEREPLVSGTVSYTAEFSFDSAWDNLTPLAVFEGTSVQGKVSREMAISDGKCTVPWETLLPGGYLRIGVYGIRDGERLPTIYTDSQFVARGAKPADPAAEYTPGVVEQFVAQVAEDRTAAEAAAERAENAAVNPPKLSGNQTWMIWNPDTGVYEDTEAYSGGEAPAIGANGNWWVGDADTGVAAAGKAATIEIVGTETLEAGQPAAVEEAEGSTAQARKYTLKVPKGPAGEAATVEITGVETLASGQDATLTEGEDSTPAHRKYVIGVPKGGQGDPGKDGLGVPVPTAEDAGKVPTVNGDGTGYELEDLPAGGGEEVDFTIEISEAVKTITINADNNGKPLDLSECIVLIYYIAGGTNTNNVNGRIAFNETATTSGMSLATLGVLVDATYGRPWIIHARKIGNIIFSNGACANTTVDVTAVPISGNIGYSYASQPTESEKINKIVIGFDTSAPAFGPGSKIRITGR